ELVVGAAEVPLEGDQLAFGVTDDPFAVAAELRDGTGQQHEPGEHPGAELVEELPVAPVAVDLPVGSHRAVVHDSRMRSRWLRLGHVGHGTGLYRHSARPGRLAQGAPAGLVGADAGRNTTKRIH